MTGYVGPGTNMPLSTITVASLADIGYSVTLALADPYVPTAAGRSAAASRSGGGSSPSIRQPSESRWAQAVDIFYAQDRDTLGELLA
jgi:hypothetical protein